VHRISHAWGLLVDFGEAEEITYIAGAAIISYPLPSILGNLFPNIQRGLADAIFDVLSVKFCNRGRAR
jgi:hypothetical protein